MIRALAPPELCATTVRTLSIDAIEAAKSGHPGAPMGLATIGWRLFTGPLRHSPANPAWPGRDRFVLSAGHASMLLYALLHLTGYDLPMSEIRRFRQWESATPGHPERGDTPGVEVTTGPLGQGIANCVGLALAERLLAARFNRPGHDVVDHRTWFICSDGDLMEGISHEAASLAGFLKLDRLIGVYDDNGISLDGPTSLSFGEDVPARFGAYGWRVLSIEDGNDIAAIDAAFAEAEVSDGRPTLIVARTHIGYGAPNKQDSAASHGSPLGPEEAAAAKRAYGWTHDEPFHVPDEVAAWRDEAADRGRELEAAWRERMDAYAAAYPEEARELGRLLDGRLPDGWADALPRFGDADGAMATRQASGKVLNAVAVAVPEIVQGAADLASSTNTTIKDGGVVEPGDFAGRNIYFGVREHAMGAIANGMAAHGGLRPVVSTFLQFSDYMKNTVRLAALMRLPSIFVFTHDSVGLGEDGPTHQPVEHLAGLRAIPGLVTLRPADANETAAAWRVAVERTDGPTALILTRQGLPTLEGPADVARGAYVLAEGGDVILIASGSEVSTCLAAREALAQRGIAARVVSMPSFELFAAQDRAYRDAVLPPDRPARVAVEAAASLGWHRWVGDRGEVVAIDRFGVSAPGGEVLARLGISAENVAAVAERVVSG
ncbi:MAG: transketolase [Actinomycetota bacterium]